MDFFVPEANLPPRASLVLDESISFSNVSTAQINCSYSVNGSVFDTKDETICSLKSFVSEDLQDTQLFFNKSDLVMKITFCH